MAAYAKIICDLRFVDSSYLPDVKAALQKIVEKQYVEGTKTVLTSIVEFSAMVMKAPAGKIKISIG